MLNRTRFLTLVLCVTGLLLIIIGLISPPVTVVHDMGDDNVDFFEWDTELKAGQKIVFSFEADKPAIFYVYFRQWLKIGPNARSRSQFYLLEPQTTSYTYSIVAPRDDVYTFGVVDALGSYNETRELISVDAHATLYTPYASYMLFSGFSFVILGIITVKGKFTDWSRYFYASFVMSMVLLLLLAFALLFDHFTSPHFFYMGYGTVMEALTISFLTFTSAFFLLDYTNKRSITIRKKSKFAILVSVTTSLLITFRLLFLPTDCVLSIRYLTLMDYLKFSIFSLSIIILNMSLNRGLRMKEITGHGWSAVEKTVLFLTPLLGVIMPLLLLIVRNNEVLRQALYPTLMVFIPVFAGTTTGYLVWKRLPRR